MTLFKALHMISALMPKAFKLLAELLEQQLINGKSAPVTPKTFVRRWRQIMSELVFEFFPAMFAAAAIPAGIINNVITHQPVNTGFS